MSNRRPRRPTAPRRVLLRESAPAVNAPPAQGTQRVDLAEASTGTLTRMGGVGRRYRARLIEGDRWGTSGYYSRQVLERDGPAAYPAGTLMFFDHPALTEAVERPERSVRDLAARTVTTPVYDGDGLYAEIEVFPHAAATVEALADTVGLSIRGEGTGEWGTVDGRSGLIITGLVEGQSIDFVTRAGAGGRLVSLLEAARGVPLLEARNVGAWIEAQLHLALTQIADQMYGNGQLTRDERVTLSNAVGDALQAWTARVQADAPQLFQRDIYDDPDDATAVVSEAWRRLREATTDEVNTALLAAVVAQYGDQGDPCVWVVDYDADRGLVWYYQRDNDGPDSDIWQEGYTLTTSDAGVLTATLAGDRVEVIMRTVYVPAPDADDTSASTATAATESHRPTTQAPPPSAAPTAVTASAPPAAPTVPIREETPMGTDTGPTAGQAGSTDTTATTAAVPAAISEANAARDAALAEAARATTELARLRAVEAARPIATEVLAATDLPPAATARVLAAVVAEVPLTESNTLDEATFRTRVTEAATAEATYLASLREAAGEGRVTGLGTTNFPGGAVDTTAVRTGLMESYKARGMSEEAARLAAAGRP